MQGDKSPSTYYEPTLLYRVGESRQRAKIASWGNQARADALSAWLSDWLRLPAAQ